MPKWQELFSWMQRETPPAQAPEKAAFSSADKPAPEAPACDLSRLDALVQPHTVSPFGGMAPALSPEAIRLSLELAQMTYTLDITPWMQAGWVDFSFQIDDTLESDPITPGSSHIGTVQDEAFLQLANLQRMRRAQAALRAANPLTQVMAALRQREGSDTVKAVCMAHPLPDGKQLVAIGFMGTGRRFYDWISNLRCTAEDGFHKGFYQLCRHFEQAGDSIFFPETARRLGLGQLTLGDILDELRYPDSRFRLWMAGHSQGGAVMQIYAHRLMTMQGVKAANICGYGFASPTAAASGLTDRPWDCPLWHLQNRDDLVPRVGAQAHLGLCLDFLPDEAYRRLSYLHSPLPADESCRVWMRPFLNQIRDTADNLTCLTALIRCVAEEKGEENLNALMDRRWRLPGLEWLLELAGDRAQGVARQMEERNRRMYRELTGRPMDEDRLRALADQLRPHVRRTSLRRILSVLAACLSQPHQLTRDDPKRPAAYPLIVCQRLHQLRPFRWEWRAGQLVKRYAPCRPGGWIQRGSMPDGAVRARATGAQARRAALRRGKARLGRG